MSLIVDLGRALAQIGDPRFRAVLWKSLGLTLLALALVFWATMLALGWLLPDTVTLPWIGEVGFVDDLASWAAVGLMLVLSVVLMVPAAAGVVGFFLEDVAEAVEARHYPALPPARSPGRAPADRRRAALLRSRRRGEPRGGGRLPRDPAARAVRLLGGERLPARQRVLPARRRSAACRAPRPRRSGGGTSGGSRIAGTAIAVPLSVPILSLFVPMLGVAVFVHQFQRVAPE